MENPLPPRYISRPPALTQSAIASNIAADMYSGWVPVMTTA